MIGAAAEYIDWLKFEKHRFAIFLIWLFQFAAVLGISFGYENWFLEKTPITLSLHFLLAIWLFPTSNKRFGVTLLILVLLGFLVEWIGLNQIPIFGEYEYGKNFGTQIQKTPILIGLNWCVLALISSSIAQSVWRNKSVQILFGGLLMLIMDVPMEFVASEFDYWHFESAIPPLENYLSWFVIGIAMQALLSRFDLKSRKSFSINLYLANFLFFGFFTLQSLL